MASDVRKPPVDEIFALHLPQERGKCRWCGEPTAETDSRGKVRWWHSNCEAEYLRIIRLENMRFAVEKRDKGICANCEEDWSDRFKAVPASGSYPRYAGLSDDGKPIRAVSPSWISTLDDGTRVMWCPITWVSLWHVEHKIPLWRVAHMPAVQRIKYFMLDAVETWCEPCHKVKTRKESADRAKINERLREKPEKPKQKLASRPLRSGNRLPPKGSQKLKSRPFQKRPKRK